MKEALSSLHQSCQEEICTGGASSETLRIQCRVLEHVNEERLETALEGRLLRLQAGNGAAGLSQVYNLRLAARSHSLPVFLGQRCPRFKRRILWQPSGSANPKRIAELGYNTVIVDSSERIEAYAAYGLDVFVSLNVEAEGAVCPLDPSYRERVQQAVAELGPVAGILGRSRWCEASFTQHPDAEACTLYDLVLEELELLEGALAGKELIYYSPAPDTEAQQAQGHWLETLCDDAGKHCSIAFSAVAGEPWDEHRPLHPFWKRLQASPDCSTTPLLPIVNVGGVAQGEGLWPSVPIDTLDEVLARMKLPCFDGLIALTPSVPEQGTFLDASLWIAAQSCWENSSPRLLEESWFRAWYPEQPYAVLRTALVEIRQLVLALGELETLPAIPNSTCPKAEQYRVRAEGMLGRLNALRARFAADEPSEGEGQPLFTDYLCFFVRDAKRRVLAFIQRHHISMANVLSGKDMLDGFWTRIGGDSSRGISSGAAVECLNCPESGKEGSKQAQIYRLTKPEPVKRPSS